MGEGRELVAWDVSAGRRTYGIPGIIHGHPELFQHATVRIELLVYTGQCQLVEGIGIPEQVV